MGAIAQSLSKPKAADFSLLQMLKPEILSNPYPFYLRLRENEPVHWDAFLHSWVITSYAESVTVLSKYKASRTPTPEQLEAMGLSVLGPYAEVMLKQMMFMDAPTHTRLRSLCSVAFTPRRVEALKEKIQEIADQLLDRLVDCGEMDLIADFAGPFPAIVTTALLGIPTGDHLQLKVLATNFAELMGNFDHDPDRLHSSIQSLKDLQQYFHSVIITQRIHPQEGLISTLMEAEIQGNRLSDEEIVANVILVLIGGLEETTNLIGNGILTLLRNPNSLAQLRDDPEIVQSAVEELLRFEAPTQHTGRIAPEDVELGGKQIRKGDALTVVLAAANRDPARFDNPEELELTRADNRHLSFGWASHYCFGSPLSRMSGQIAFNTLLKRLPGIALRTTKPIWRENIAMHGLTALQVSFDKPGYSKTEEV
ncbi:cytochrome P450 [Granulicella arctica]|uniref:cytochrome P450 n=1 Tax=Granulicella arctica TaxID=940613 RepID=UPI0021DFDE17|nr:cytochrome P450 [Granulicella arctica]